MNKTLSILITATLMATGISLIASNATAQHPSENRKLRDVLKMRKGELKKARTLPVSKGKKSDRRSKPNIGDVKPNRNGLPFVVPKVPTIDPRVVALGKEKQKHLGRVAKLKRLLAVSIADENEPLRTSVKALYVKEKNRHQAMNLQIKKREFRNVLKSNPTVLKRAKPILVKDNKVLFKTEKNRATNVMEKLRNK